MSSPVLYYPFFTTTQILLFVIVTTYSIISPLILPFGLVHFAISYIILKYCLLYVYEMPWESGGKLWPLLFDQMMFGLIIQQVTLVGVFSIQYFALGAIVGAISIFPTIAFWIWMHKRFDQPALYGTLDDQLETNVPLEARFVKGNIDPVNLCKSDYIHPVLHSLEALEDQQDRYFL